MPQGRDQQNGKKVLVALGGNVPSQVGGPRETLVAALDDLRAIFTGLMASEAYETPCFPVGSGPDFVNAACVFETDMQPTDILATLHKIEGEYGRTRTLRWGQRTLDLDLIACGQDVLPDDAVFDHWRTLPIDAQKTQTPDDLILPHPRLQDRLFVLIPLADIAPDWRHPVLGRTVLEMISDLPVRDAADIRRL